MARANQHHIPGQVWHILHRCYKQEFLLKFARDRRRWYHWLFEARKRFGLRVLNYVVKRLHRECCWTESIAVGNKAFVEDTKLKLGIRSRQATAAAVKASWSGPPMKGTGLQGSATVS